MKFSAVVAAGIAMAGSAMAALDPIVIRGNAFYTNGSNDRFYIRGVDYQPGGSSNVSDPLADSDGCKRDVPVFKNLGVNAIRVYTVDNSADHDDCMSLLDDAGIYLLLDVNTPKQSLNRNEPGPSYNAAYLQAIFATVDAFKKYDNVLGFFSANEVINDVNSTATAPYVKAVTRDLKRYIKAQSSRTIPVGYSAADISQNRWQQMEYFNCGNESETIDMFGMNDYSWCGDSSFQVSGYQQNVENYGNYSIPMFFSEYGCNKVTPREFSEVETIYSSQMSPVYSGGLVYEYSQEANNYGLVKLNGDSVSYLTDFYNLKYALGNATDPSGSAGASTTRSKANCPSYEEGTWEVRGTDLPEVPSGAEKYFSDGAGKALGFNAPSTQWSSGNSSDSDSDSDSSSSASASSAGSTATSGSQSSAASTSTSKSKGGAGAVEVPSMMNSIYSLVLGGLFSLGLML